MILVHIETFIQQRLCAEHRVAAYLHRGRAGEQLAPEGAESVGGGGVRGGAGGRGRGGGGAAAVHRVLPRQPQPRQLLPDGGLAEPRQRDLAALRLGRLVAGAGAGLRGGHHSHSLTGASTAPHITAATHGRGLTGFEAGWIIFHFALCCMSQLDV